MFPDEVKHTVQWSRCSVRMNMVLNILSHVLHKSYQILSSYQGVSEEHATLLEERQK